VNAVRTHIEHFIGSNPLLASTSCTDPVNNLKNQSKISQYKTPGIILNPTEINRQQTQIRSRSPSPFWIKGETSTYSEVVKTGFISKNNSRNSSPEIKHIEDRMSRKSNLNLLQNPLKISRSKSSKDKWQHNDLEKNTTFSPKSDLLTITSSVGSSVSAKESKDNLDITLADSKRTKRRSRSRRNKNTNKNIDNEYVSNKDVIKIVNNKRIVVDQNMDKALTAKPEIVVSYVKNNQSSFEDFKFQTISNSIVETCAQTDELIDANSNSKLLATDSINVAVPSDTVKNLSKSRSSLASSEYSNSCYDLNEQLKGIFGSVDKKHYRHCVFDRPRSKSDTRDLNKLTQIFTSPNNIDQYTCRFERSAESVKNNSNRDSTSSRRSFDNILSHFEHRKMEQLNGTDQEHNKTVRLNYVNFCFTCAVLQIFTKPNNICVINFIKFTV
jgi:hypothetical protein